MRVCCMFVCVCCVHRDRAASMKVCMNERCVCVCVCVCVRMCFVCVCVLCAQRQGCINESVYE